MYSNTLQDVEDCAVILACKTQPIITELSDVAEPGVMLFLRQPKFKYRAHFKENRIPRDEFIELFTILTRNKGQDFKPSMSLRRRMNLDNPYRSHVYVYPTMYFDFNDETMFTYLTLKFDCILGKRFKLEKRT